VLAGIVVAIALSLVAFVQQAWRPYRAELGRVPGLRGYHDLSRNPAAERIPGLVIVRFDAPLFFANGAVFDDWVRSVVADAPGPVRTVVLAAEPITDIDTTAVEELVELDDALAAQGIRLVIAEMKDPVRDTLRRYGLDERFGPERFAPTVGAAVDDVTGRLRTDIGPGDVPGDAAAEARDGSE
jgi:MFS superfamily sulfate permease-like transporter